jgi:hypothetical protein
LKQSKKATTLIFGIQAGDVACPDVVWTSVVTHEHIAIEIQRNCETEKQTKSIFMRALCARTKDNGST